MYKYLYDYDLNDDIGKNLNFRFYMGTDNDDFCDESELENDEKFEFIEGYASVDYAHCGLAKSSAGETGYSLGYIRLNPAKFAKLGNYESILNFDPINLTIDEAEINPITKAAWMYTMMNAPRNVTEGCESTDISDAGDATYFILDLINHLDMLATIGDMFMNPNEKMKSLFIGSDFDPDQSVIRLHEPDGVKIGGGYRVKEVRYGDNWNTMTAGAERESIYGTKYVYTTVSGKQTISSGVAAWEPQSGGEENPYRKPSTYSHLSDTYKYEYYINQPYGEVFFPSPIVGYSRVEEIPFGKFPDDDPMTSDASYQEVGKTVSWFYTAYDYPTKVSHTEVFPINNHLDPSGIVSFFADVSSELFAASQGYTIESNDMHGKPKRVQISNANGSAIISDTEYEYFESPDGSLNNIVPVLNKFGRINEDELGVTYDVYADYRKNNTYNLGGNVKLGVDGTGVVFSPSAYPQIVANYSTSAFTVLTKNVQRNGIIKSVTTTTNGSKVTSSNLAFDGSNGMALIVEQQNEFDDKYYSVTIPTHFIYDELGYASSNQGYKFKHDGTHTELDLASSKLLYDAARDLVPGDKVFLSITGAGLSPSYTTAWVYQKETAGVAEGKYLVDAYGFPIDFTGATLIIGRVIESGKKNMAGAAAMQVICKENPIVTIEGHEQLQLSANSGIIDASATEYSDIWRIFCTDDIEPDISCECNDFVNPPANDLANIFKSLISTGNLVTDPTQVLLYDHTYAGADYYYHGCTPEFLEAFGFSMDGVYNVVWSSEIVGDNLQCNLIWLRNPGEPQICSFELGTADDVMNLGNAYGSDLLGDMNFEMIVPNTAVVGSCGPIDEFTLNATYYNPSTPGYVNITLSCESFTCFPLRNCNLKYTPPVFCMGSEGDHANPYLLGIRGNWQPKIAFKYLTDRTPEAYFTDASPSGNEAAIRDQGLYTSFIPFWSPNALAVWEKNTDPKWTWTAQTMLIDPLAHTASVKDALDIYSSSTYNLNHVAAELVANNAKYNQIAFENYEDDFYLDVANPSDCHSKHFDINPDANGIITRQFAHSGNFSMRLAPGGYADYTHTLSNPEENRTNFPEPGYIIESKDCMPDFAPGLDEAGTKYLMTFWYRDPIPKLATGTSTSLNVEITLDGDNLITSAIQIGDEIERWRRVELEFTMPDPMPTGDPNFVLKIENTNTGIGKFLYIDDIRIIPSESQAMGYVYDFITQRLVAELDDNHFTTFYEYDNEGNLIRIKKETERGIYTIQEARYNTPKSE